MDLIPKEEVSSVNKKAIFIGVGVFLLVVIVVFFVFRNPEQPNVPSGGNGSSTTGTVSEQQGSDTFVPVSGNIEIPDTNSQVGSDVAKPTEVKAVGTSDVSERDFNVVIDKDLVTPQKVIVKLLDIVTINFSALDKSYDMAQPDNGLSWTVPKGGTKSLQFQGSTPGQFTFYCVSCGGPDKGPVGHIVVVPK